MLKILSVYMRKGARYWCVGLWMCELSYSHTRGGLEMGPSGEMHIIFNRFSCFESLMVKISARSLLKLLTYREISISSYFCSVAFAYEVIGHVQADPLPLTILSTEYYYGHFLLWFASCFFFLLRTRCLNAVAVAPTPFSSGCHPRNTSNCVSACSLVQTIVRIESKYLQGGS